MNGCCKKSCLIIDGPRYINDVEWNNYDTTDSQIVDKLTRCYTKSEGYSFGVYRACVRPSIPSVRPHFLSVRNHISVPIGQI